MIYSYIYIYIYICEAVIHMHALRVSQLLLPSSLFPDMCPATNSFSWYKRSIFD